MADTGAPAFIPTFGDGDPVTPIQNPFNSQASAVNSALAKMGFAQYATRSALPTTGVTVGAHATVTSDSVSWNNGDYWYDGTRWQPIGARFALTSWATNTGLPGVVPLIQTGFVTGTTTSGGVLGTSFNQAFPNACDMVVLSADNSTNQASGTPPQIVRGTVSAGSFQTFWGGRGSAAVSCPYFAIGH